MARVPDPYRPDPQRYDGRMPYRRVGRSGLDLPAISLGLWQNFGGDDVFETGRALLRRAFDRGVTHFDLANNYGPPYGSAEENFGRWMASDFAPFRDELIVSTKAGFDMWPGPYGGPSGSRKYIIASCDQSLARMGLDYVDIFYSHRMDETVPLEETCAALAQLHRQGKALYIGISSYTPEATRRAARLLAEERVPLTIHQPRYSMLDRGIEDGLLGALEEVGAGCIVFSPLAQGLLTDKYLGEGAPAAGTRLAKARTLTPDRLTDALRDQLRALDAIARKRGQRLAQLALGWTLRDRRVTSTLVGARTVEQLDQLLDAAAAPPLTEDEVAAIDAVLA
ncbi:aldo/keto reductase [Sphingomonas sp. KR1UV-12]|uniref:Aldo/keto reductase n=1 Tax=Sphingomonas aurea TaxID=3063994 RepID=A0ABT9EN87_9SPHN|nr:aldo/keto reductase [Sphingomonas sp. KR1UV-12]MDP1028414.1 aldo/keto reductase [Sphingomonas sp. KR1UV-12]